LVAEIVPTTAATTIARTATAGMMIGTSAIGELSWSEGNFRPRITSSFHRLTTRPQSPPVRRNSAEN
jgi:hypothetical protein